MKRLLCAVLSAVMLLSLVSCRTEETDSTQTVTPIISIPQTSESTTEETSETSESADTLEMSINDVSKVIFDALGDGYRIKEFSDPKNAKDNAALGIQKYMYITNEDWNLKQKIQNFDTYKVEIYLLEYDMNSAAYKDLTPGKQIDLYAQGGKVKPKIAAVSKQFAVCIETRLGKNGIITNENKTTRSPFNITKVQDSYQAFVSLGVVIKPIEISMDALARNLLDDLGDNYEIKTTTNIERASDNRALGVLNYMVIGNISQKLAKKSGKNDSFYVRVYVIEYDLDSPEYKKLYVGGKASFFNENKETHEIIAIHGQYVLCVEAAYGIKNKFKDKQIKPPFKINAAQTAYDTFVGMVPKTVGFTNATLPDITRDILKAIGRTEKDININYQDQTAYELNTELGVLNFVNLWKNGLTVTVYILEMDTASEQYKSLDVGKSVTFYEGTHKNNLIVAYINNQYVLCIYTTGKKKENKPPFKDKMAKNVYDTFRKET